MSLNLPPWRRTDSYRRAPHQAVIDALNRNLPISADHPLEAVGGPNGTTIRDSRPEELAYSYPGYVYDRGPGGQADYTDERYWIRLVKLEPIGGTDVYAKLKYTNTPTDAETGEHIVTATNLSEVPPISSTIPVTHKVVFGSPVELTPYVRVDGADGIESVVWAFTSGLIHSKGQYQGQTHQMGADNADEWLMPLGVPVLIEVIT